MTYDHVIDPDTVLEFTDCGEHNGPEVRGETTDCEICGVRVWVP